MKIMTRLTRTIALVTALTVASTSCGYILYPERRGNRGGVIDGGTLVMDLLWLLPGVLPGVVFLIVDFSSGTMYVRGGRMAMRATPEGSVAVKLRDQSQPMQLRLSLVTASHRVLAEQVADLGPGEHDRVVELAGGAAVRAAGEAVFVQIVDVAHPDKPMQLPVAL
jgi:hypothetical protein